MEPDPTPYDGSMFGDGAGEKTAEEVVSAPAAAVIRELRQLRDEVKRQGEAVSSLAIAVAQQTAALLKLTDKLADPIERKGRNR